MKGIKNMNVFFMYFLLTMVIVCLTVIILLLSLVPYTIQAS